MNESIMSFNTTSSLSNMSFNTTSSLTPLNPMSFWIILILLLGMLNFTLTLPGGLWTAWLMTRGSRATLETEFITLHLLCTDMTCAFLVLCASFNFYFLSKPLLLRTISLTMCMLCLHSQPLFQCSVCAERYVAVVHPIIYLKYKPLRYKAVSLGLVWLIAVVLSACGQMSGKFLILMAILLTVICVEMFCSLSILVVLKRSGPGDVKGSKDGEKERSNQVKKRAFIIVSLLQAKLLVNYLPLMLISCVENLVTDKRLMGDLITLAINFCFYGSFIQPVMYLHRAGRLNFLKCLLKK